ncbi:MAG: hypothetical protein WDN72_10200 [Alphaproteobacteria bacterium]
MEISPASDSWRQNSVFSPPSPPWELRTEPLRRISSPVAFARAAGAGGGNDQPGLRGFADAQVAGDAAVFIAEGRHRRVVVLDVVHHGVDAGGSDQVLPDQHPAHQQADDDQYDGELDQGESGIAGTGVHGTRIIAHAQVACKGRERPGRPI